MAQVTIAIHGKTYGIACDDGQEARVQELGKYIDMRFREIAGAGAASTEPHLLVLTALVLADEIFEARMAAAAARNGASQPDNPLLTEEDEEMIVNAINHLAKRIDTVADRLAKI